MLETAWSVFRIASHRVGADMKQQLLDAMRCLEARRFGTRVPVDDKDELGELASAFNRMSESLELQIAELTALAGQAYYDTLTHLPNRLLFKDRLDQEMARSMRSGHPLGLLYIDLDHFKRINDSLGHGAGDELLQIVATRLREAVKEIDTVARLGGDEFVIIMPQLANPESSVALVAERILTELSKPIQVRGQDCFISASIGVTLFPQDGHTAEELIKNADATMYRAKKQGRSRALFFESHMNTRAMQRWSLQTGLHRALQARQFTLHYQPQVELKGGALGSAEALIRWNSPNRGQRVSADFIPVAEQSGLILEIGDWALNEACRQYAQWRREGEAPPRLALNISAEQLRQRNFLDSVRNALIRSDVPPWALELEFQESALLADLQRTGSILAELADLGVRLAVDDFGAGLSSVSCLRHYPIEVVKIDRSLVNGVLHDANAAAMSHALILMARSLGKQTVAEGVESEAELEYLKSIGCDFVQGYFLGRPMPAEDFLQFMRMRAAQQSASPDCMLVSDLDLGRQNRDST